MIFNSYNQIFKNQFAPHPEVISISWTISEPETKIIEKTIIEKSVVSKEEKKDTSEIDIPENTLEDKSIIPSENSVSYEIRDITPKKHFWRK